MRIRPRFWVLALAALFGVAQADMPAADVRLYGATKGQFFFQFNAGTPTASPGAQFAFAAFVELAEAGAVTNASVQPWPLGAALPLAPSAGAFTLEETFTSQSALDAAYPNGDFRVVMSTVNDGARAGLVRAFGNAYPSTPRVSNFNEAQEFAHASAFTLRWDAFTGGAASDFVQVIIADNAGVERFRTPDLGVEGALNGTATSVVIPANTLPPGTGFTGRLRFLKLTTVNTADYPGAIGVGGYFKETEFTLATAGAPDTIPPALEAATPADGATGVSVFSAIVFTFNEPMQPLFSIAWSANLDPNQFAHLWNGDLRTLICFYNLPLPAGATITWTLNPPASAKHFRDVAGNPLPTGAGSFTTAANSGAPDAKVFGAFKGLHFRQTDEGAPTLVADAPFSFLAFVDAAMANAVTGATVRLPTGQVKTLAASSSGRVWEESFSAQAALDVAYRSGTYAMTLATAHDGTVSSELTISGDAYPAAPRAANFLQAHEIDAAEDFTLRWDRFVAGTVNDFIEVTITNDTGTVFATPRSTDEPGGLDGTATSVTIPAGTLEPGRTFAATVRFANATDLDVSSYPGVVGFGGYFAATSFTVSTVEPIPPPLTAYGLLKQRTLAQTSASAPVLESGAPFLFQAAATPASTGSVASATLRLPIGSTRPLASEANGARFLLAQSFSTENLLEGQFPSGAYDLLVEGDDDVPELPLILPANVFPNAPRVSNFSAAQIIDPTADFTLTWDAFADATGDDAILLIVFDSDGEIVLDVSGAQLGGTLPGSAMSAVIPAGTLTPNTSFPTELVFMRRTTVDTKTLPGATGTVAFRSRTKLSITTKSAPAPPSLAILARTNDGRFQLRLTGVAGRSYAIEGSTSLKPGSWTTRATLTAFGGTFIFTDDQSTALPHRFYRARLAD